MPLREWVLAAGRAACFCSELQDIAPGNLCGHTSLLIDPVGQWAFCRFANEETKAQKDEARLPEGMSTVSGSPRPGVVE